MNRIPLGAPFSYSTACSYPVAMRFASEVMSALVPANPVMVNVALPPKEPAANVKSVVNWVVDWIDTTEAVAELYPAIPVVLLNTMVEPTAR